jgi:hypothetical protein
MNNAKTMNIIIILLVTVMKLQEDVGAVGLDDDDDVYLKKITTRVLQNLILHKNTDQPKAQVRELT